MSNELLGWKEGYLHSTEARKVGVKNTPLIVVNFSVNGGVYPHNFWLSSKVMKDGKTWTDKVAESLIRLGYTRDSFVYLSTDTVQNNFKDHDLSKRVLLEYEVNKEGNQTDRIIVSKVWDPSKKNSEFESREFDFFLTKARKEMRSREQSIGDENTKETAFNTDDIPF